MDYKHSKSLKCGIVKGGKCYGEKPHRIREVRLGVTE